MARKRQRRTTISEMDWASHKRYPGSILCLNCREVKPSHEPGTHMVAYCAICQQKGTVRSTLARAMEKLTARRDRKSKQKEDQNDDS